MQKSVFFRRVLALLLLAVLLWAVLTIILYSFISRPVFINIKIQEVRPKAELVADTISKNFLNPGDYLKTILDSSVDFFDAWIYVVDGLSGDARSSDLPESATGADEIIREQINSRLPLLMNGEYTSVTFTSRIQPLAGMTDILFVGVPVTIKFAGESRVIGAVFFVRPLDELVVGLRSLNLALGSSSLLVLGLMIVPVYLAIARLVRPLRQTRDVALAMMVGDFSVRADATQKGEFGELAEAMNNLAGELEANISALTLERNRLRQIITGMNEGLAAVDRSNRITQVNPAFWSLLGLDTQLENVTDQLQWPDMPGLADLSAAFGKAVDENIQVSLNLQRGSRLINASIAPMADESGAITGALGLFSDITEAERLEQTRRDYIANVSHELRTPLTAMRALIEPLRDGLVRSDSDRDRYYGIMLRESIRLSRLIDDMLELSRLQAGTAHIPVFEFALQPILQDLAMKSARQIEEAGLRLSLPDSLAACPPVIGNPDRVEQVLVILMDNAVKYTPAGGDIHLRLTWDSVKVHVSVADTGVGIAPEDIRQVFDRFYKADKAHQQPGTGLGLSIAREIIQRLGQKINVRSEPGKGSVFTFTLDQATPETAL